MTIPAISDAFHNLSSVDEDMRISLPNLRDLLTEFRKPAVRSKYNLAVSQPYVHMDRDTDFLSLSPLNLLVGSTQDQANVRANSMQLLALSHAGDVGTLEEDGDHLAADLVASGTLAVVPVASSLPTCITLINALFAWHLAHAIEAGVHFTDDVAVAGNMITHNPPTTLAHCVTDLNDLRGFIQGHVDRATP